MPLGRYGGFGPGFGFGGFGYGVPLPLPLPGPALGPSANDQMLQNQQIQDMGELRGEIGPWGKGGSGVRAAFGHFQLLHAYIGLMCFDDMAAQDERKLDEQNREIADLKKQIEELQRQPNAK